MAAALHPMRAGGGANVSQSLYQRAAPGVDLEESRYTSKFLPSSTVWYSEPPHQQALDPNSSMNQSVQRSQPSNPSYPLPQAVTRSGFERYNLDQAPDNYNEIMDVSDNNPRRTSSAASRGTKSTLIDLNGRSRVVNQASQPETTSQDVTVGPSSPRHPSTQLATISAVAATPSTEPLPVGNFPPILPLSASPTYSPPIAPKHRAQPQQPTFIIPSTTPNPLNTVLSPIPPQQQEEVCMECAMRDQDMADVDVTSPGVWDRESDVLYEELKQRQLEEETNGNLNIGPSGPRAISSRLTEQNLKLWLTLNPREPASKQQSLHTYIKVQRTLLEAEGLARVQAMQEAKQLDSKMRDTISQLRRSAYDLTSGTAGVDDTGGLCIRPPLSPIPGILNPRHTRSHSREITLLENGMIVEHVDVRKEEREERQRRKKDEKRARKSSRSSVLDVTSIISAPSNGQYTDAGLGLKPYSRYSQSNSARPNSVLTVPSERPDIPTAYSQASFSDVHSVGSTSPRRSKFLGFRNLNSGWKSRESLAPSGISGSMIDMHLALQREPKMYTTQPIELNTPRRSQIWSTNDAGGGLASSSDKQEKKKNGLTRIWRLVTGSGKGSMSESRDVTRSIDKFEDDLPLTPPPPLSYLVDRGNSDMPMSNGRHSSTPSLPSITSNKLAGNSPGMSPPTPPSSVLPSPASSRPYGADVDHIEVKLNNSGNSDDQEGQRHDEIIGKNKPFGLRKIHPVTSEPDIRGQVTDNPPPPIPQLPTNIQNKPLSLVREKSLPPLPGEITVTRNPAEARPQTMYNDPRSSGLGFPPPSITPFRNIDVRRQSFGGVSSRPNVQTMSMKLQDPHALFGLRYDEFGISRRSLGRLEYIQKPSVQSTPSPAPMKKKNKFLSSLLGKKQTRDSQLHLPTSQDSTADLQQFPPMRRSGSGGQEELGLNGYATSTSRHSALSMGGTHPLHRTSFTSRKALEGLVFQDPEFVAYRYPSNDQHLDLLR
ncbi:hypothetical protein AX15_005381 [Amanita polypyramis BW_CC]|nr:hypothetical protein AX15_005381 [Amanita polypyramis BW_CC]